MSLIKYEPMSLINQMHRDMNEFFRQHGGGLPSLLGEEAGLLGDWAPRVDIKEEDKQYVVTADIPGVDPRDIDASLANGVLSIRGERRSEKEEEKKDYRLKECSFGSFQRNLRLPEDADPEQVKAKGEHGVLKLTIGKREGAGRRKIEIES